MGSAPEKASPNQSEYANYEAGAAPLTTFTRDWRTTTNMDAAIEATLSDLENIYLLKDKHAVALKGKNPTAEKVETTYLRST